MPRTEPARGGPTAASTAYDEIDGTDRPVAGRAVHQEASREVSTARGAGVAQGRGQDPVSADGETRSERDVRRLASLERLDRGRARAGKSARAKSRT